MGSPDYQHLETLMIIALWPVNIHLPKCDQDKDLPRNSIDYSLSLSVQNVRLPFARIIEAPSVSPCHSHSMGFQQPGHIKMAIRGCP